VRGKEADRAERAVDENLVVYSKYSRVLDSKSGYVKEATRRSRS